MVVAIRPLRCTGEYHACEALQRRVWEMPNDLDVVPLHLLLTMQKHGGLLLGAFDGDDLVGFVFGFPGFTPEGKVKHCSHMMGVAPGRQGAGVGYQLKLAQREFVIAQGLDLVTWTYDPLESRNANLNLGKLGGECRTYIRDFYGPMIDGLNAGLPSDRFQVEWWIGSDQVRRCLNGELTAPLADSLFQINSTRPRADGLLVPSGAAFHADANAPAILVEIPADYQLIKAADPGLALEWRLATRDLFETCFAAGYAAVDFVSRQVGGQRRSFYVLQTKEYRCRQDPQAEVEA